MITLKNITKTYESVRALDGISLDIGRGELFGLIGPDGAGKSTLMRILMTLILPDSGEAQMNGLDVVRDFRKVRQMVGYMPGRFSLYQDLTVEENLNFFATVFGTTVSKNYDLIHDIYLQIEPFRKRRAGKLSGGMKQKLALSCALIHKPVILVLDEPTTGVDAVSRKEFWEMLKKLQKSGITILVSTPYMDEATRCDRVALIQKGKILDIDTPERITGKFPGKIIQVHTDDMYRLIKDLRNYPRATSVYAFGQYVHFSSEGDDVETSELDMYLARMNHTGIGVEEIPAGIEDVFMNLMSGANG